MNFQSFSKPVPRWFFFFRLLAVVAGLAWLGYDSNFKPVAQESARAIAEITSFVRDAKVINENAIKNSPSTLTQQANNGAAK